MNFDYCHFLLNQLSSSAVIVKRDTTSNRLSDEIIDELCTALKAVHGADPQAVDNFVNNLYGFRDEATDAEAMNSFVSASQLVSDSRLKVDFSIAFSDKSIRASREC